jgi:hypothetical protein
VLVEERVLTKGQAMCVIQTVADLTRELAESDPSVASQTAADLVEGIAVSFTLQDGTSSRRFTHRHHARSRPS